MNNNKKIVNRFLKEAGLYSSFRSYIFSIKNRDKQVVNRKEKEIMDLTGTDRVYKEDFIDSVFGKLNFTSFIENNNKVHLNSSISEYFRHYLKVFYPFIPTKNRNERTLDANICRETHEIKIPIVNSF